jgi:hypothetical protein
MDAALGEFWVGNPWEIFENNNLSAFERNRMFLNAGAGAFVDVTYVSATDDDGDGRASFAADVNDDGRLDLIVRQAGGNPLLLYENAFPQRHYLKVSLRGVKSNRLGIGARLVASVGERRIHRECTATDSFSSRAPLTVHFGLADARRVDRLEILWPSGEHQVVEGIDADRHVIVTESSDELIVATPGVVVMPE